MKCDKSLLFAGLACAALASVARADQFGLIAPWTYARPVESSSLPAWMTQPSQPATPAQPLEAGLSDTSIGHDVPGVVSLTNYDAGPMQAPAADAGLGTLGCGTNYCCAAPWVHRSGVFGELLFLRARSAEVAYAVPVNGAIVPPPNPPIQVGRIAVADPDYALGFRVGGMWALDDCSSVSLGWARFQSSTNDSIGTTAPLVLRSLVLHPGTANAGADFLNARAALDVDFDLVDADYRAVWGAGDFWVVNYLIGARYARLNQDFTGVFTNTGTTDRLFTNLNFDGGGFRLGLDGARFAGNSGLLFYGRTSASFIAGEFRGRYSQGSDVDPIIVSTNWKAGRLCTILDMELGAGWQSRCGRVRLSGGYMVMGWFNAVRTNTWIQSVQQNNFVGLGDTITFDGFTARAEYRF